MHVGRLIWRNRQQNFQCYDTYNSSITHITLPFSNASYIWISLGCWSIRIISISLSTFLLSSFFGQDTYLAASANPEVFSLHLYTIPNFPLKIWFTQLSKFSKWVIINYLPISSSKVYSSLGSMSRLIITSRYGKLSSISGKK